MAALVTGGASGLGAATTRALAAVGVKVAVLDLDVERGQALATGIGGHFARCDVTDDASMAEAIASAAAAHGPARLAVACAGVALARKMVGRERATGAPLAHDAASFARVIAVNLTGTFRLFSQAAAAMAALPKLENGERGVLVATASIAAQDGQIGQTAYAASKAGVVGLVLPAARDLAEHGIRCMAILPGLFDTPMLASLPDDVRSGLAASVPFPPRLGNPDEFAQLVLNIAGNPMLNGSAIRLDGALRMPPR